MLKFTEAAPTDGFAGEEVDQSGSLLTANAAACSCLFFFESWPQAHQLSRLIFLDYFFLSFSSREGFRLLGSGYR